MRGDGVGGDGRRDLQPCELRKGPLARGHRFVSGVDTKVLVHVYEEDGVAMVDPLEGMYAFALWDARQRELLVGRVRFGEEPLFYR
jgi:asparagine synthase (glutamine-hydrolysing)